MICQTLILQDFGPYGGRHRLNLRPDTVGNANRPIILIGSGKTTLMDALRLVLYGHNGEPLPKHRLSAGEKQILAIAQCLYKEP